MLHLSDVFSHSNSNTVSFLISQPYSTRLAAPPKVIQLRTSLVCVVFLTLWHTGVRPRLDYCGIRVNS